MQMKRKFASLLLANAAALLMATAPGAWTQAGPGLPPGPGLAGFGPGASAPDDALGFVGFEAGLTGKTVTGEPFTADFSIETTQSLPDGNRIDNKTTGSFARDSQGRTRRELTLNSIAGYPTDSGRGPVHGVVINDPVAGVSYVLNENRKEARASNLRKTPFGNAMRGGGPGANAQNRPNVTTQSLGTQLIGGISAEGTRTTRTIPAGTIGNERPIELTVERWYSNDLQTYVLIKRNDPRGGTTVFQLTNVLRAEPDASLFQVPSDYTVISRPAPGVRRGPGPRGQTPPPQQ